MKSIQQYAHIKQTNNNNHNNFIPLSTNRYFSKYILFVLFNSMSDSKFCFVVTSRSISGNK